MSNNFQSLGVRADLVEGLDALGIQQPTPVQTAAIPFLLKEGGDLIASTVQEGLIRVRDP